MPESMVRRGCSSCRGEVDLRERVERELTEALGEERFLRHEPMSRHTTFRVGGEADYFLMPSGIEEIRAVCRILSDCRIPVLTMGNGSNLLVSDEGFSGAVLCLGKNFSEISEKGEALHVQAGALLSAVARFAAQRGLTGLEFAAGIPGSLGGAITMNAGAYGGEMKQVVCSVCAMTPEGEVKTFSGEEMEFGYRSSIVARQGLLVLSAELSLRQGDREAILEQMRELAARRREKQPLEYASAGSTFKRPEGHFAGKLIMEAGLAGFRIGGAQVSEKHCGFVINTGGATAAEVAAVIRHVQRTVWEKFAVRLEPEVRFAGRFDEGFGGRGCGL